ncbi:hypothetical protein FA95DRAFT_1607644 [Auriscalpium vulgare]|uniref:Uncharacterized protein n=1 Tax=Auriscalpium vulgare TaxID=40419 RepID=A0ACB8RNN6_9AGAM|nr:hypothetical protein FA95DRAFT_1607644 [Auriscalpium vulgare]
MSASNHLQVELLSRPPGGPGALIIGVVLAAMLYGVTSQQVVFYFGHFPQDGFFVKLWVIALWILDTVTTALSGHVVYNFFVLRFGELSYFPLSNWAFSVAALTTGAIIFLVQAFFIFRIRKLRRRVFPESRLTNVMFVFFTLLSLYAFATSIQLTYYDVSLPEAASRRPIYISNITIGTGLDVLITFAMVLILHQHRNEFAAKRNSIEQLIFFFFTRGVILTVFQALQVTLSYAAPKTNSWFVVFVCISKVYANSALVTLNNRERLERRASEARQLGYMMSGTYELSAPLELSR